jgi:hypothetical protein
MSALLCSALLSSILSRSLFFSILLCSILSCSHLSVLIEILAPSEGACCAAVTATLAVTITFIDLITTRVCGSFPSSIFSLPFTTDPGTSSAMLALPVLPSSSSSFPCSLPPSYSIYTAYMPCIVLSPQSGIGTYQCHQLALQAVVMEVIYSALALLTLVERTVSKKPCILRTVLRVSE